MAYINGNKPIVTNGLVYALDFGNTKSYTSGSNTARSMVFDPAGTTSVTSSAAVVYPTYTLTTPFYNNGVLDFTGPEFIRRTGSFSILDPEKAFTIQIVSKVDLTGSLFSINTTSGNLSTFVSQSNTTFGFNITDGDFSRTYRGLTTSSLQHVTYRYSSGSMDIFINGLPVTASLANQSLLTAVTTNALFINKDPNTDTFQTSFSGSVAQFYVYNRALNANEIYNNYLISAERYEFPTTPKPYTVDENVYKYIQTTGITDANTISALETFVSGLKLSRIWDKIVAIYPFLSNNTGSQAANLKDPGILNLTFTGSWSSSNLGSTPNTSTSYIVSPVGSGTLYPTINSQSFHTSILSYDNPKTSSFIAGAVSGQGALGGTVTYAGGKVIHTFTTVGSSSFVLTNPSITNVEILVVAGGGGGGRNASTNNRGGGGGGAGGLIYSSSYSVTPLSTLDIVVGSGGIGGRATYPNSTGSNGGNSQFGALVAIGGGGGGSADVAASQASGSNGGSGGGAGRPYPTSFASGGLGTPGQGNDGGIINDLNEGGGSGGGGAAGKGFYSGIVFSEGGPGLPISTSGIPVSYSAGGRSGHWFLDWTPTQVNALPNTGNGGWGNRGANGGTGGSGIVIISYNLIPGSGPKTGIYLTETSVSGTINNETPSGITGSGTIGLLTISRTGSGNFNIHKNNISSSISATANPKVSLNLPFGATNEAGTISSVLPYQISYASIGSGLTTSEVATYHNLIGQLQANLKRQNTLLDNYSGAAAAYSLRRIGPSNYFGPAIRVRRDSDNTLRDIGFTSDGQLDTVGLLDFVGVTGSGFVQTWYDQSGNGYDMSQNTLMAQPWILTSGSLQTQLNKPAVLSPSASFTYLSATPYQATDFSTFTMLNVLSLPTTPNIQGYAGYYRTIPSTGDGFNIVSSNTNTDWRSNIITYTNNVNQKTYSRSSNKPLPTNTYLEEWHYLRSVESRSLYENSATQSVVNNGEFNHPTGVGSYMWAGYKLQNRMVGYIQELISYNSYKLSNRAPIASNITNYYTTGSDPDYQAFITATGITQPTQSAALETLVSDLKSYGLWNKMKAIYPMITDKNNRLSDSQNLTNNWSQVSSSLTVSSSGAPDGSNTGFLFKETADTSEHYITRTVVDDVVSGLEYVVSFHGKYLNRPWMAVKTDAGVQGWFNVQTGITGSFTGSNATITPVSGGWYRCALYFTASTATAPRVAEFHLADSDNNLSYAGNTASGSYIWGVQWENGNVLGPYRVTSNGFTTGSMLDQMKYNLKDVGSFSGSYFGGWNPGYSGNKPKVGWMDTTLVPTSSLTNNNYHLGVYLRTQTLTAPSSIWDIGAYDLTGYDNAMLLSPWYDYWPYKIFIAGSYPSGSAYQGGFSADNQKTTGFMIGSRISNNSVKMYQNNAQKGTTQTEINTYSIPRYSIYVGAINVINTPGNFSNRESAFATIGDGLTDYEAKALYWIVQKYQTTLGRQVY